MKVVVFNEVIEIINNEESDLLSLNLAFEVETKDEFSDYDEAIWTQLGHFMLGEAVNPLHPDYDYET